jgi:membrane-bound serine protease (ClpP class)
VLHWLNIALPWPVYLFLFLFFGAAVFIIHRLVIPAYHRRATTGREGLIGLQGHVIEALKPAGTVKVNGEYWKARSIEGPIESGENVEITGSEGMLLEVKRLASRRI